MPEKRLFYLIKPCAQPALNPVHKPVGNRYGKPLVDKSTGYTQDQHAFHPPLYTSRTQPYALCNILILIGKIALSTENGLLINSINIKLLKYLSI